MVIKRTYRRKSFLPRLLLDIDGVLLKGGKAINGSAAFITKLTKHKIPFKLLTNNSTKTSSEYAGVLQLEGISVKAESILTSGIATATYLSSTLDTGSRLFVIGESGLIEPLKDAGFELTKPEQGADCVVVGLDRYFTYEKLQSAMRLIESGAKFVATSADARYVTTDGVCPGAGALVQALAESTGCHPTIIGKPHPVMFQQAIEELSCSYDEAIMFGDNLISDIKGANDIGMMSVFLTSGVHTRQDLAIKQILPSFMFRSLQEAWFELRQNQIF